jgi:hypothetical protein
VVGESDGAGGRFEEGLDQPLELAIHGDVPYRFPKADKSGHRTQLLPIEKSFEADEGLKLAAGGHACASVRASWRFGSIELPAVPRYRGSECPRSVTASA